MEAINTARLRVWAQQPADFFDEAIVDVDGTLVATDAECKEGVDIAYDGTWGYHPLVVSLANTGEPLYLVNRSGNRPSHEQAARLSSTRRSPCAGGPASGGSTSAGDTDFSQTEHLDRWDDAGDVRFLFGIDAHAHAQGAGRGPAGRGLQLPGATAEVRDQDGAPPAARAGQGGDRPSSGASRRSTRSRRWSPSSTIGRWPATGTIAWSCSASELGIDKGQVRLFEEYRYFFFITNDRETPADADRLLGQRSLRPGEPDRAAQGRRAGPDGAGGRPGEQLGVHGDGVAGVEPEGVGGVAGAGGAPACSEAPGGEADAVADGVRDVPRGDDRDAVPDRAERAGG